MKRGISSNTRHELIEALSERYRQGSRSEKGKILDELVKLTKSHRKHAVRPIFDSLRVIGGANSLCCKAVTSA